MKYGHRTGIKRKWLRVKIKNKKGSSTAINCRAKLDIIEGDSPIRPYDTKRLMSRIASTMDIYPKDNGEFVM